MLSAIFSRMENKTLEIEEMEKMVAEAEAQVTVFLFIAKHYRAENVQSRASTSEATKQ